MRTVGGTRGTPARRCPAPTVVNSKMHMLTDIYRLTCSSSRTSYVSITKISMHWNIHTHVRLGGTRGNPTRPSTIPKVINNSKRHPPFQKSTTVHMSVSNPVTPSSSLAWEDLVRDARLFQEVVVHRPPRYASAACRRWA